jgi:hypothetical protein
MAVPIKIGQIWRRRMERHEPFDVIEICGFNELGKELPDEFAVRDIDGQTVEKKVKGASGPATQNVATVSTTAAALEAAFTLVAQPVTPTEWDDDDA